MKESGIVSAITAYLQYMENQNKLVYQRNNSGAFINQRGNFFKMGKPGSPDFYVFLPRGRTIHMEVKKQGTKQNLNQLEFEIKINQLGHVYGIVRSVDEAEELIKTFS
jgi:hypothetical protein